MSPEFVGAKDVIRTEHEVSLTPDDQVWLASFGVDPLWQDNPALLDELTSIIAIGSRRLNDPVNQTTEAHTEIIQARIQFMNFIGVPEATLGTFLAIKPTIVPLDTFINTQRTFTQLGLDAAKVINASPAAIGYAPESVRAKFDNLIQLGLDAAKVINALPAAISYAPESVRAKFAFLEESIALLNWEYSAQELVQTYPAVLGFSPQKLRILRRIAAYHIDKSSRSADPKQVRASLIVPLEKYVMPILK